MIYMIYNIYGMILYFVMFLLVWQLGDRSSRQLPHWSIWYSTRRRSACRRRRHLGEELRDMYGQTRQFGILPTMMMHSHRRVLISPRT